MIDIYSSLDVYLLYQVYRELVSHIRPIINLRVLDRHLVLFLFLTHDYYYQSRPHTLEKITFFPIQNMYIYVSPEIELINRNTTIDR